MPEAALDSQTTVVVGFLELHGGVSKGVLFLVVLADPAAFLEALLAAAPVLFLPSRPLIHMLCVVPCETIWARPPPYIEKNAVIVFRCLAMLICRFPVYFSQVVHSLSLRRQEPAPKDATP